MELAHYIMIWLLSLLLILELLLYVCVCVCVCREILESSGQYKYLHSAVIMGGLMLVFGGNTHNDTIHSHGAKCYSTDFMAYDIGRPQCCIVGTVLHGLLLGLKG